ncbi:MAG TPA: hypothetical protein VK565_01865, partial [Gemmatimonadaceae bacterium]|nr:hypothetical protein [Gemmatimonadaceae bacterium]
NGLVVSYRLERVQAAGVPDFGGGEFAAHVHEHATVVLDYSKQCYVAGFRGEIGCVLVQPLTFIEVASPLGDNRQAVVAMRLAAHGSAPHRVSETLLVTTIGGFCIALFAVQSSFPSQRIGEKSKVFLVAKTADCLFVESQRHGGIATLLGFASEADQFARI